MKFERLTKFKKTVLKNGITVVTESHPTSHAASVGIWVQTGTRNEHDSEHGVTHFLEHLVFKGTKKRTSYQISKSLEALGGELNAFTTREYTCYHAMVLKDHAMIAMDVLADLAQNMELKKEDFELEKSVVLQEITMSEDQLEDLVYDIYLENCFKGHELGRSILGTEKSISSMKMSQVKRYYRQKYCGAHLIVAAAGNVDHQEIVETAEKLLRAKGPARLKKEPILKPRHRAFRAVIDKPTEQLHFLAGMPCSSFRDRDRFEAYIVNALLGGGMTSKLYQSVREKKGLVYSIYSTLNTFKDIGLINIYAASEPKNMKSVIKTIFTELKKSQKMGISSSDLSLFKTQIKGSILLGADDIETRMQSIAVNEMVFSKYKPVEEIIAEIDEVTVSSVNRFIREKFDFKNLGALLIGGGAGELEEWFAELKI